MSDRLDEYINTLTKVQSLCNNTTNNNSILMVGIFILIVIILLCMLVYTNRSNNKSLNRLRDRLTYTTDELNIIKHTVIDRKKESKTYI
jgi:flagellar biosynthesis/type III secretory pathway M-ring protein FliF/YscJ